MSSQFVPTESRVEFSTGNFVTVHVLRDSALTPANIARRIGLPIDLYVRELRAYFKRSRLRAFVNADGSIDWL